MEQDKRASKLDGWYRRRDGHVLRLPSGCSSDQPVFDSDGHVCISSHPSMPPDKHTADPNGHVHETPIQDKHIVDPDGLMCMFSRLPPKINICPILMARFGHVPETPI